MKIAIVGTGVSGLVAAHHLHRQHEITVYEAAAGIGGPTHTVAVPEPGGGEQAIDTGFIVFNDRNYPNFEALLGELGVGTKPSHMSFSVSDGRGGVEFSGTPSGASAPARAAAARVPPPPRGAPPPAPPTCCPPPSSACCATGAASTA